MSRENVELVRRMLETWNAGDVEGWLDYWHADAEWRSVPFEAIEGRRSGYRGHEGLRRFAADLLEGFASPGHIDVTELRDLDDWVLMLGEYRNEGGASGATTAMRMGWLFEVRGGRIVRGRDFLDQQEALEAAERAAASP